MLIVATSACEEAKITLDEALWDLPAAIAYQLHYKRCQQEGMVVLVDDSYRIRKALIAND